MVGVYLSVVHVLAVDGVAVAGCVIVQGGVIAVWKELGASRLGGGRDLGFEITIGRRETDGLGCATLRGRGCRRGRGYGLRGLGMGKVFGEGRVIGVGEG